MSTFLYAILTDGTDTFTFGDGTQANAGGDANVVRWQPAVAELRNNTLGGQGEFEDAVETLVIDIVGATKQACWDNLIKLRRLLNKAETWRKSNGRATPSVLFKFSVPGATTSSTSAPLVAAVLGRASGDKTQLVQMPASWPQTGNRFFLRGVTVSFRRRGQLELANASQSASHNSVTNGDIATLNFGAGVETPSPTIPIISNGLMVGSDLPVRAVFWEQANGAQIINAETMTATSFASATPGLQERNGSVLRYTPIGTNWANSGVATLTPPNSGGENLFFVFANLRNTAAHEYLVRFYCQTNSEAVYYSKHPYVVQAGFQKPQWCALGYLATPNLVLSLGLSVKAGGVGGALDIDSLFVIYPRYPFKVVQYHAQLKATAFASASVTIDPAELSYPSPTISAGTEEISQDSDIFLTTSAQTVYACLLATQHTNGLNYFRLYNSGVLTNNWSVTRRVGYQTPT